MTAVLDYLIFSTEKCFIYIQYHPVKYSGIIPDSFGCFYSACPYLRFEGVHVQLILIFQFEFASHKRLSIMWLHGKVCQ